MALPTPAITRLTVANSHESQTAPDDRETAIGPSPTFCVEYHELAFIPCVMRLARYPSFSLPACHKNRLEVPIALQNRTQPLGPIVIDMCDRTEILSSGLFPLQAK